MARPKPLPPGTKLRLARLWPHARKAGLEHGDEFHVGPYCPHCGLGLLYLFDAAGKLWSTWDRTGLERHFDIAHLAANRDWYVFPPDWPLARDV